MNIGFDLDGVLYKWHEALYTYLICFKNVKVPYEEFWSDTNLKNGYLTYGEDCWYNWTRLPTLVSCESPKPTHVKFLNNLAKKHEIYYITHRPEEVHLSTLLWIKKSGFPYPENVLFPQMGSDKTFEIRQYEIGVYVDDRDKIVRKMQGLTNAYLVMQPWNESGRDGLNCISDVTELEGVI
jgi:hypothetical protein